MAQGTGVGSGPQPGTPGYSAQEAITRALVRLAEVRSQFADEKARAEAQHAARVLATTNRQRSQTQTAAAADARARQQASRLTAELAESSRMAAEVLRQAQVPRGGIWPTAAPGGTGDVNATIDEINTALADFQASIDELARVRETLLARIRRSIGLAP